MFNVIPTGTTPSLHSEDFHLFQILEWIMKYRSRNLNLKKTWQMFHVSGSDTYSIFTTPLCSQPLTAEYVEASPCVDLPVFGLILPTQEGALHAHHAEHEAQRANRQRPHQQPAHYLDVACRGQQRDGHFNDGEENGCCRTRSKMTQEDSTMYGKLL